MSNLEITATAEEYIERVGYVTNAASLTEAQLNDELADKLTAFEALQTLPNVSKSDIASAKVEIFNRARSEQQNSTVNRSISQKESKEQGLRALNRVEWYADEYIYWTGHVKNAESMSGKALEAELKKKDQQVHQLASQHGGVTHGADLAKRMIDLKAWGSWHQAHSQLESMSSGGDSASNVGSFETEVTQSSTVDQSPLSVACMFDASVTHYPETIVFI
jgi:ABC-type phosphate transport system auxiliary subunit